ncbi:uncharacterized protein PHACADRAFT_27942 [Phanerochaete carnosa HHB-10118-sp]|uniref:VIT domain-containing protein n=1 Tax=Phanerochaete carnosa (strain HHB-10118-sp) TaxID=650164 RepID=K5X374_PHACS|nr:uncharacterized protein PHACADRAFT_27942 [Phanerochaete carnosa HHB-10118-sp]EKM57262.1 hypothetical protein PHACADRAFT_27942 [Phanerochaete carnosa HHB-10118-sp]
MVQQLRPVRNKACSIIHVQSDLSIVYLPLEKAEVHADVADVSAIVTVTQYFLQSFPTGILHAKYIFPVPAKLAVCGFQMTVEDSTVITTITKERDEAKRDYKNAVQLRQTTGLVELITNDVFSISVGALPIGKMITTTVTYMLNLMEDDATNQIRLQIPIVLSHGAAGHKRILPHHISISIDVCMQDTARSIASPTHLMLTILDNRSNAMSHSSQYLSQDFLTQDFVLCIAADGLDTLHCVAECASTSAVAMQLNIVPKFNLLPIVNQEYIFLVDCSGSMEGSRIETAQHVLVMLLRVLPS